MSRTLPALELRAIRHSPSLSQETSAFTADLYVDGKKFAHCSNDGNGGQTFIRATGGPTTHAHVAALEALVRDIGPKRTFKIGGQTHDIEPSLDGLVDDLLSRSLIGKEMDRVLKRAVLFLAGGQLRTVKPKGARSISPADILRLSAAMRQKYPDAVILNELPRDKAFELYCVSQT